MIETPSIGLLLGVIALQLYLLLPPGIPFIAKLALIPLRLRLSNYALIGVIAYGLYIFGFTLMESLALASFWMLLAAYLVFDYIYDLQLLA